MSFDVHHSKDFEGTAFVEIGPGKYTGKHWQPGFLFIDEDYFFVAESLITACVNRHDHYAMNDYSRDDALAIVDCWRSAARTLVESEESAIDVLRLERSYNDKVALENERAQITHMLESLAASCDKFIEDHSGFCILGL